VKVGGEEAHPRCADESCTSVTMVAVLLVAVVSGSSSCARLFM